MKKTHGTKPASGHLFRAGEILAVRASDPKEQFWLCIVAQHVSKSAETFYVQWYESVPGHPHVEYQLAHHDEIAYENVVCKVHPDKKAKTRIWISDETRQGILATLHRLVAEAAADETEAPADDQAANKRKATSERPAKRVKLSEGAEGAEAEAAADGTVPPQSELADSGYQEDDESASAGSSEEASDAAAVPPADMAAAAPVRRIPGRARAAKSAVPPPPPPPPESEQESDEVSSEGGEDVEAESEGGEGEGEADHDAAEPYSAEQAEEEQAKAMTDEAEGESDASPPARPRRSCLLQ